jgi:hypothetical protein
MIYPGQNLFESSRKGDLLQIKGAVWSETWVGFVIEIRLETEWVSLAGMDLS